MTDRSGIEFVELTVLEALGALTAGRAQSYARNSKVLSEVEQRIGLGPRYGYDVLLDLARPWTIPIRLVTFQGNYGDPFFPAASPAYTESRLSNAAEVVTRAERQQIAPVPVGLINGTAYRGGIVPPLSPARTIGALHAIMSDENISDDEIREIVGSPTFPAGCAVTGDLSALASGRPITLQLSAQLTIIERSQLVIESLPPGTNPADVLSAISDRASTRRWEGSFPELHKAARLAIDEVDDQSDGANVRLVATLHPHADPEEIRDRIGEVEGVKADLAVRFPQPLAKLLRTWLDRHRGEDVASSIAELGAAIKKDAEQGSL